jgi:predicted GNAT family acetyltransferase
MEWHMNDYKINENRIYLERDGKVVAYVDFSFTFERDEKVSFDKVFVDESLRGQGIAADITKFAVDHFKDQSYIIIATCPYVDIWMKRHMEEYGKYMVAKKGGPTCSIK